MNLSNKALIFLVVSISFVIQKRLTRAFGGQRSIQLSYGCLTVHLADWSLIGNGLESDCPAGCTL
ncbi:hypothetical protein CWO89_22380 [Bradyrhizobium sp. Leo170]|nr:hypothetical protein CWO89_22380 [Bradyrhizobium sp. Leo170]